LRRLVILACSPKTWVILFANIILLADDTFSDRCKPSIPVIIADRIGRNLMERIHTHCKFDYKFSSLPLIFSFSPLVMKVRSRSGSVMSGASTPGGGAHRSLSEGDLKKADAVLSQFSGFNVYTKWFFFVIFLFSFHIEFF
jgi:hypothetical protein